MLVYSLFIKCSMVCYFNNEGCLFSIAFFTVALLIRYCLLAFNVSFFSEIIMFLLWHYVVLSNVVLLCWNFYILSFLLFMLRQLKIVSQSFQSLQQKSFYINLFVWQLIGNLADFLNFNRFDLFKQNKLMVRSQFWIPRLWFQHLWLS